MDPSRFDYLVSAHFDDQILPDEQVELEAALLSDAENCRLFWQHAQYEHSLREAGLRRIGIDGSLSEHSELVPDAPPGISAASPRSKSWSERATRRALPPSVQPTRRRSGWFSKHNPRNSIIITAVLFLAVGIILGSLSLPVDTNDGARDTAEKPDSTKHVAILNGERGVTWIEGERTKAWDPRLWPGEKLVIDAGLIELKYLTGARVVIEGPAEFVVGMPDPAERQARMSGDAASLSVLANGGFLGVGRLVARCDAPMSKGFVIVTRNATVVDLGTVFAVSVDEQEQVATHVLEGAVELHGSLTRRRLSVGQSATIRGNEVSVTEPGADALASRYVSLLEPLRAVAATRILSINWTGNAPSGQRKFVAAGAADNGRVGLWNQLSTAVVGHSQPFRRLHYHDRSLAKGMAVEFPTPINSWTLKSDEGELSIFSGHINTRADDVGCRIKITGVIRGRKYDLYLYAARRVGPLRTEFTVAGSTKAIAASSETSRFAEDINYVVFRGVEPDKDGGIEIGFGGEQAGHFSALQLIEQEPLTDRGAAPES
ncbi:MAG: hypothetical protein MI757_06760 [Pirellulales bacterium]|nr:hypothetical protein [Pirellulales bacterium]